MALIDIHTHILYGVDDGAKDINDSMGLLDEEREQGVDQVILTPITVRSLDIQIQKY